MTEHLVTVDPFSRWRDTALWRVLDAGLQRAEADGVLQLAADDGRDAAIGLLCMQLDIEGQVVGTRLAGVRAALHAAGWTEADHADSLALELCARLDRGEPIEHLADYIARFEGELLGREPSAPSHRLALSSAVRRAYEHGGEPHGPHG